MCGNKCSTLDHHEPHCFYCNELILSGTLVNADIFLWQCFFLILAMRVHDIIKISGKLWTCFPHQQKLHDISSACQNLTGYSDFIHTVAVKFLWSSNL